MAEIQIAWIEDSVRDMDREDVQADIRALEGLLLGVSDRVVPASGLVVPQKETRLIPGSTAQLLAPAFTRAPSGLFVPEATLEPLGPLDLISVFITGTEVFGHTVPASEIPSLLTRVKVSDGVTFCANLLRVLWLAPSVNELEKDLVRGAFAPPYREVLLSLLAEENRRLFADHVVLRLLREVLLHSSTQTPEATTHVDGVLLTAYFGLADLLPEDERRVVGYDGAASQAALESELVANQWFYKPAIASTMLFGHLNRWEAMKDFDPRAEYEVLTGRSLQALESAALAALSAATNGSSTRIDLQYFLGGTEKGEEIKTAVSLISVAPEEATQALAAEARGTAPWSFDTFERYPLLRLDEDVLLISPALLISRVFSWAAVYDVPEEQRNRFTRHFQVRSEIRVRLALESIFPSTLSKSLYTEEDQRSAFGRNRKSTPKTADFAVDCSDAWLVIEATATQPTRDTIRSVITPQGGDNSLQKDVDKLVAKVRQIASTIELIRDDEQLLTGRSSSRKPFIPVLVCTEGFPVNPVTRAHLDRRLTREGLLQEPDVLPLRVLTALELEAAEAACEETGASLVGLLVGHLESGLADGPFHDYLIRIRRVKNLAPRRVRMELQTLIGSLEVYLQN